MQKHQAEILRIEKGKYTAEKGSLRDFYIYAFSGEKIGIIYKNPNTAYNAANVLCGNIILETGIIALDEKYLYYQPSYQQKNSNLKNICHMVCDENKLNEYLNFWENFHLLTHPNRLFVQNKYQYISHIHKLLKDFDPPFDLLDNIKDLTPLQQKIAELMMAYLRGIKIIIIYTPNNYLSKSECGLFMDYVDKLSSLGIAFFIFDHDTEYLMRNSDRIFVIEHGITTAVLLPNEYSFIHSYFFKDTERKLFKYPSFSPTLSSDTRSFSLSFNNVYTDIFKDISFEISSGEILSIVCPRYNDFIEFKKLLFSDMHPLAGSIYIYDKPFVAKDMTTAISQGMYLLDENATSTMVDENLSLLDNCYFEITHKAKIPFIPNGYYYSAIRTLETFFEPDQLLKCASSLTHFEKTKLVLCKIMLHTPKILVCMNPFAYGENKELDLIKKMLMRFANGKMSILILSLKSPTISDIDMCSFSISSHGTLVQL